MLFVLSLNENFLLTVLLSEKTLYNKLLYFKNILFIYTYLEEKKL